MTSKLVSQLKKFAIYILKYDIDVNILDTNSLLIHLQKNIIFIQK